MNGRLIAKKARRHVTGQPAVRPFRCGRPGRPVCHVTRWPLLRRVTDIFRIRANSCWGMTADATVWWVWWGWFRRKAYPA
jgi:hypothetical protein